MKVISCRWVYRVKEDEEGEVSDYKSRLVARGFEQKFGNNFTSTFAPTAGYALMRLLLVISV
jgi:histone deacetylase 1/2